MKRKNANSKTRKKSQIISTRRNASAEEYNGSVPLMDPKHEIFCVIFTTNTLPYYWGHAQHSYMFAYGYIERVEKINEQIEDLRILMGKPKKQRKGKSLAEMEREIEGKHAEIRKIEHSCRTNSPRLTTRDDIKKRCGFLLDQLAIHKIVDRELVYLINQRDDNDVKIKAIAHHDKREQRIREKMEIKHEFEPITGFDYVKPVEKRSA